MQKARFERPCFHCGKVIRGTNPAILEINYALHLKWHELRRLENAGSKRSLAFVGGAGTQLRSSKA